MFGGVKRLVLGISWDDGSNEPLEASLLAVEAC